MKHKVYIDSHKGTNALVILGLMAGYHAWDNLRAWIYLALHGTYGLLWVLKSRYFGDKNWEREVSLWTGLATWFGLSLYWVGPWLIVSGRTKEPAPGYIALCISLYVLGVFLHFASDMQKHATLAVRPGLISDGLWAALRNPNYLGELFIYLGFTMLCFHPAPLVVLALFVLVVWLPNMRRKDRRLSRHEGFAAYRARSRLWLPWLW